MNSINLSQGIDLREQVAIVTGSGRGIGRAIALALANAGASVAVVAQTEEHVTETMALIKEAGGRGVAYPADVTNRQAVDQMVAHVEQLMGPVNLLVNNAGYKGPIAPSWEVDPDEWWRCIDVNLRGPFLCSRAVVPGMIARGYGRIITTASDSGLDPWPNFSAYATSKCAIIRLMENMAAETSEHCISVFSIHPGFVRTAMTESALESPEDEKWLGGTFRKAFSDGLDVPPEHAAQLVVFLASGRADVLSGCFISISDDVDEMVSIAKDIHKDGLYTLRLRK